jgi:hypothetical protein
MLINYVTNIWEEEYDIKKMKIGSLVFKQLLVLILTKF